MSIFAPIISLCLLLVILLPLVMRPRPGKVFSVSVTALTQPLNAQRGKTPQADRGTTPNGNPVTASGMAATLEAPAAFPALGEFAAPLLNGHAEEVVGVYVAGQMALPVRQQPANRPDFVADEDNLLTQFALPGQYGAVGLLAHNYRSGRLFPDLVEGDEVLVIYGGGQLRRFVVTGRQSFQALSPTSPFSHFIDLQNPAGEMTSADLFKRMYTTPDTLVFQTCIEAYGEPSWGRLFITAVPADNFSSIPALQTLNDLN